MNAYDAIVVGGGYCGSRIALHLRARGLKRVALIEQEPVIMGRASMWNQARVHGGYHYPRASTTARACRRSYQRFIDENRDCTLQGGRSVYAIVRDSRVSPVQFEQLCQTIDAPLRHAPRAIKNLFDPGLVEAVYLADEVSFDATVLAARLSREITAAGVTVMLGHPVTRIGTDGGAATVAVAGRTLQAELVFNCTYAALGSMGLPIRANLRREWAEMALIEPPQELIDCSVTVMDGPFFSTMPFPAFQAHTLSHVRFTPVASWKAHEPTPSAAVEFGVGRSLNAVAMIRDASRYVPAMRNARLRGSIFETKTILTDNDDNDGRPILLEKSDTVPGAYSILSGKIDNVYDIIERIDRLLWQGDAKLPAEPNQESVGR
jgi:glycine/D-amino acid oxidase-like deaminating enzyme